MWLAAVYNATIGPRWTPGCAAGWEITNPGSVCSGSATTWHGVQCSGGAVTSLNLAKCNLQGPLLDPTGFFTGYIFSLVYVDLSSNNLIGTLPGFLNSNLSSLRFLNLSFNSLTGTIPSSYSSMSFNSLTGTLPYSWHTMPTTATCNDYDLSFNYLTGDIPSSWLWSNATIGGNYVTGNCLIVSNLSAVFQAGRFCNLNDAPRAFDECASSTVSVTERTRHVIVSVSPSTTQSTIFSVASAYTYTPSWSVLIVTRSLSLSPTRRSASHSAVMTRSASHSAVMTRSASHVVVMTRSASHVAVMTRSASHSAVMTRSASHVAVMTRSASRVYSKKTIEFGTITQRLVTLSVLASRSQSTALTTISKTLRVSVRTASQTDVPAAVMPPETSPLSTATHTFAVLASLTTASSAAFVLQRSTLVLRLLTCEMRLDSVPDMMTSPTQMQIGNGVRRYQRGTVLLV